MRYTVFDLEADNLYDEVTLIHCLSYSIWESGKLIEEATLVDYDEIRRFIPRQEILVGHEIIRYDIPVLKKVLGIDYRGRKIDTLGLSWCLYPAGINKKHGLEQWGEVLGVPKPPIADWKNLTQAEYIFRCESDREITNRLFHKQINYLLRIYDDHERMDEFMSYISYKLECAWEQYLNPLRINRQHCEYWLAELQKIAQEKIAALEAVMPEVVKKEIKTAPAKIYKQDGTLSANGVKWMELLFEHNLDAGYTGNIEVVKSVESPNATSIPQLKAWLFSLGWQPTIFEYKEKDGVKRGIPQINDKEKNLCPGILRLAEEHPVVEHLAGLFMVNHRIGIFEGFLEMADADGYMKAEIQGFTNTLRFKHKKPFVNLPKIEKPYGQHIRGAIIAPDDDHIFCGSDMSSLEDNCKQHYMYFYDPEYVMEMRVPGFDPHIDIGLLSNMILEEEAEFFRKYNHAKDNKLPITEEDQARGKAIAKKRGKAKTVNFAGVYGAGPPKISLTSGMSLEESTLLHTIYWKRNKAVKLVARDCVWKTVDNQMWLWNPVSRFWYSLRYQKDKFSTLNQGTGVYCFDTWVRNVRNNGIIIRLQYHDEIGFPLLKKDQELVKEKLKAAIQQTNEEVPLNVPLGISIDFGPNYADCH